MKSFHTLVATILVASVALVPMTLPGQVPDAPAPAAPAPAPAAPAPAAAAAQDNHVLGKDAPFLDPGSDIMSWDGKHWNINNNRLFSARFEKYLNAEAENSAADASYREVINAIIERLTPYHISPASLDQAFRMLPKAASFPADANLSEALASSVFSVWQARREDQRMIAANDALEAERKQTQWNAEMTAHSSRLESLNSRSTKAEQDQYQQEETMKRTTQMQPYVTKLAEIKAQTVAISAKRALSEVQTKLEFQGLIVQYFMQRRFQHVLMATQFYRAIFSEGDTTLKVGTDAQKLFASTTGMPPTVSVVDSLAREAIRDVKEGVEAYNFLLSKDELESATKRLGEAFAIGEFMPEMRTLTRDKKRQALAFTQKSNQLLAALEVKDYTTAEHDVRDLEKTAKDFDNTKPMAAIETAKTVAAMHLAKAKNAAVGGDRVTLETELKAATEIWPRNPALSDLSTVIFSQADVQQKALMDFDQLLSQHNYRQIFDDRYRYISATALAPERQDQLKGVLTNMETIEGALMRGQEIAKRGDYVGAWEAVEHVYKQFPDDNKLNQARATYTTEAADFVRALRTAEQLEDKQQYGSSLAWYLKAQKMYPPSDYASTAIARLVKEVLPES